MHPETRTYDALNRLKANADNDYRLAHTYADIGFASYITSDTQEYLGQTAYPLTVTKSYDSRGNVTSEGYPAGANLTLTLSYNSISQLTSITDGTNSIASYSYVGFRRKTISFGNGATQTNSFTGFRNEIASIDHKTSAQASIVRMDYGYNKVHDRLYERFGASGAAGDAFVYDKIRRLTSVYQGSSNPSSPSGNSYVTKIDYNYDDDGNRQSIVTTPYQQSATTVAYTTNSLNQYTVVGGTSRTHDANGNLTDDGTNKYTYDYKNQIVEIRKRSDSSLIVEYKYDALGRRIEKNVTGTGVERYVLCTIDSGNALGNLGNVMATYDGTGNWKQSFVHNGDVDDIVMLEQKDVLDFDADSNTAEITRSYYHQNALGSVMEITDANEATVARYRYSPYGPMTITRNGQTQTSDPLGQHWGYTGRFADEESGLWYYRARYYDPVKGRFLQRDPLGYAAGPGLYAYVRSMPTRLTDANGLDPIGLGDRGGDAKSLAIARAMEKKADALRAEAKKLADVAKKLMDMADGVLIKRRRNGDILMNRRLLRLTDKSGDCYSYAIAGDMWKSARPVLELAIGMLAPDVIGKLISSLKLASAIVTAITAAKAVDGVLGKVRLLLALKRLSDDVKRLDGKTTDEAKGARQKLEASPRNISSATGRKANALKARARAIDRKASQIRKKRKR